MGPGGGCNGPVGKRGVLLIEDDLDVGLLLADIFATHGLSASLIRHPSAIPVDSEPTLVVTDLFGPAWYDREIAVQQLGDLRGRFPGVPLVLVTAHSQAELDRAVLPVDAVVGKPFDVDALAQLILSFEVHGPPPLTHQDA
jgi:DNA-binding NtrC family response regulator